MRSIICVAITLALLVIHAGCASTRQTTPPTAGASGQPNILLIVVDDLGWTDIATGAPNRGHGSDYVQTPTIDRLARQGMSFSNMHVNPNCAPTRAALMTGQESFRNGVFAVGSLARGKGRLTPAKQDGEHIRHEAVTLAETLHRAGYRTAHVGKYHVSSYENIEKHDGFDVNYGGGRKGDGGPKGHFAVKENDEWTFRVREKEINRFAEPYTRQYIEKNLKPVANGNDPGALVGTPKHLTDADTDAALDFLTRHVKSKKDQPFFMNVAFSAVHTEIAPRPDLLEKYKDKPIGETRQNKPEFAALTEGVDQAIARILRFLDDNELADDTLILFVSDNGGSGAGPRNAPLRASKGTFYEGGIRVPMIARLPGAIDAGTTSDALLSIVDLYPTFADFAAAPLPDASEHTLDGVSFAPLLRGRSNDWPRDTLIYHFPGYLDTRAYPCSLITQRVDSGQEYKLIYSYEDQHYELYNLTADLGETKNRLQGDVSQADIATAEALRVALLDWLKKNDPDMPTDPATGAIVPLPIPIEDALKAGNEIKRPIDSGAEEKRRNRIEE